MDGVTNRITLSFSSFFPEPSSLSDYLTKCFQFLILRISRQMELLLPRIILSIILQFLSFAMLGDTFFSPISFKPVILLMYERIAIHRGTFRFRYKEQSFNQATKIVCGWRASVWRRNHCRKDTELCKFIGGKFREREWLND